METRLLLLLLALLGLHGGTDAAPTVVLVGATGNLAGKYLWQALFDLHREGLVGQVYGGATKAPDQGTELINGIMDDKLKCSKIPGTQHPLPGCEAAEAAFRAQVSYVQLRGEDHYRALGEKLAGSGSEGLLVYLSVSPDYYADIAGYISTHLRPAAGNGWLRVVMEKPFGRDTASASALAESVDSHLRPEEVCKVDHYLGKDAVNAIVGFRSANRDRYEPLLNAQFVDKIEIVMQETETVEGRTEFFERYGIVRDVLQNHLSVMLAHATADLLPHKQGLDGADLVNRTTVLVDIPAPKAGVLGQYDGYTQHVKDDGGTVANAPTAAVVGLSIESSRWAGVPITMRVGKALDVREAYLRIVFKSDAFPKTSSGWERPMLHFQIQGGMGTAIVASSALPLPQWPAGWAPTGTGDGRTATLVGTPPPAYHVLMRAAVEGKMGSFVSTDELMQLWRVWTPLCTSTDACDNPTCKPISYSVGSSRESWVGQSDTREL